MVECGQPISQDHTVLTGWEPHGLAADSGGEEGEGEVQLAPEGAHIINVIKHTLFPLVLHVSCEPPRVLYSSSSFPPPPPLPPVPLPDSTPMNMIARSC